MSEAIYNRECNLLGALMLDTTKITEAMEQLKPEWFTGYRFHGMVYKAWLSLRHAGKVSDAVTVFEAVNAANELNPADSGELFKHLIEITKEAYTSPATLKQDIRRISDAGKRRELKLSLVEAIHKLDEATDYEEGRTQVMGCIDNKLTAGLERGLITGVEIAQAGIEFVQNRLEGRFVGLSTGFEDLDEQMFGGLRGGELITVFGPPKSGKTTTATAIMENIACRPLPCGTMPVVAVFSREMKEIQLAVRHFASLGGASQRNLLTGHILESDLQGVSAASGVLSDTRLIYDLDSDTPSQIALKCAQIKRRYGRLDLIMVDHVGLVRSDEKKQSRVQEVTEITWAFKKLAGRMDCPLLMVAQSNREYAKRQDKTPILADLAESSSIEKDSDAIIGILSHREGELKGYIEMHLVAARMGEQGMAVAVFNNGRVRPADMNEYYSARNRAEQSGNPSRYEGGI